MDRTESAGEVEFNEGDRPDDLSGEWLGRFRLLSVIGSGGSARVYEAEDSESGNRVAVKVLNLQVTGRLDSADRFLDEVRLSRALDHPNLLLPFDGGLYRRRAYLVSRLVKATNLKQLIASEGSLSRDDLEALTRQISGALDAIHDEGIIHRDVKPSNILVIDDRAGRRFLLTDLGVGQGPRAGGSNSTGGSLVGTPGYSAPEQLSGRVVDRRADVFSLACVVHEAATGRPAFAGLPSGHGETEPQVPPASALRADLTTRIDDAISRATASEPRARYRSAGRFGDSVVRALQPSRGDDQVSLPTSQSSQRSGPQPDPGEQPETKATRSTDIPAGDPVYLRFALASPIHYLQGRQLGATLVHMKRAALIPMVLSALTGFGLALAAVLTGTQLPAVAAIAPLTVCVYIQGRRPTEAAFSSRLPPTRCEQAVIGTLRSQAGWSSTGPSGILAGPARPVNLLAMTFLTVAGILPGVAYFAAKKIPARIAVQSASSRSFTIVTASGSGEAARELLEARTVELSGTCNG